MTKIILNTIKYDIPTLTKISWSFRTKVISHTLVIGHMTRFIISKTRLASN